MKDQPQDWHPETGFARTGASLIDRLTAEAQSARDAFDYRGWTVTEAGTVKRGHYDEDWERVADRAGAKYSTNATRRRA